ncbi:hypothetical protein SI65_08668 [Aspergillus cristatus]|uniref:MT-A70-domain-containing protein n=1 Tax=Aspergillus cristatus TaxID=573508 RepID=A0A1E3B4L8_ASPCR|nr:hypothetical protein SI65_08668 [Aspergillus cristatus]
MKQSSILYENASQTVFLIDIPTSITLSQELSRTQQLQLSQPEPPTSTKKRHLLSTPPLREPYPSPPEPKTDAARARLLERIPLVEREYHANLIAPLVRGGLSEIRGCYDQEWCLERFTIGAGKESRKRSCEDAHDDYDGHGYGYGHGTDGSQPPVILSSTCTNHFESMAELSNAIVKNTSQQVALLVIPGESPTKPRVFTIPALSNFLFCTLSTSQPNPAQSLIPGLPQSHKFNLILLDPPWPNRSVRRSRHYNTQAYFDMDSLSRYIRDILRMHLLSPSCPPETETQETQSKECIAAIWITNAEKPRKAAYDAIHDAGLVICEEWVWVKTTASGELIMPAEGLWRKPYEVLVIGKRRDGFERRDWDGEVVRRVIAAVPDVHSRKPNLREVLERVFFGDWGYEALEVFARNLTAGWWSVGNEVLKFHDEEWWVSE